MAPRDDDDERDDRIADMEKRQAVHVAREQEWRKSHQEKMQMQFAALSASIETVRQTANEAKSTANQALVAVEAMPAKVLEAIRKSHKEGWSEWRTWALFLFAALSMLGTVVGILKQLGLLK